MQVEKQASDLVIVLSDSERGALSIGPLYVDPDSIWRQPDGGHNYIFGEVTLVAYDGTRVVRNSGNGFDGLRFAVFRDDLRILQRERSGRIQLGDHDCPVLVELIANGGNAIQLRCSQPSVDIWDLELGTVGWDRVASMIDQVDAVERALGPLSGCCPTCPEPTSTYRRRD